MPTNYVTKVSKSGGGTFDLMDKEAREAIAAEALAREAAVSGEAEARAEAIGEIKENYIVAMEQGGIENGLPVSASNRIRPSDFILGAGKITLNKTDFRITYIFYYDPGSLQFITSEIPDARTATMNHPEWLAKFLVTRYDRTSNLVPGDVEVSVLPVNWMNALASVVSNAGGYQKYVLPMEQGTIDSYGNPMDHTNRVRTKWFLPGNITIDTGAEYTHVFTLAVYDKHGNYITALGRTVYNNHLELALGDDYCVKFTVAKRTESSGAYDIPITPSDVTIVCTPAINLLHVNATATRQTARPVFAVKMEQGGIDSNGGLIDRDNRVRSEQYLPGTVVLDTGEQWTHIFGLHFYDEKGVRFTPADFVLTPSSHIELDFGDNVYIRAVVAKRTASDGSYNIPITPADVVLTAKTQLDLIELNHKIEANSQAINANVEHLSELAYNIPTETFDRDYELRDIESIDVDYTDSAPNYGGICTVMPQIYELFDALAESYPSYVTKSDPALTYGYDYPVYANGIGGSSIYLDTPQYKTYMYRLRNPLPTAGTDSKHPLRKILLIGGTHGNEYASPYNLYLLAKQLCEDYLDDPNLYRLRASFEIFIVPCLNGYGMYHRTRVNANNIDINRNFPCTGWTPRPDAASGSEAGSEFETKLVMKLCTDIRPHIMIDHHNYGVGELHQFYTILPRNGMLRFSYQATTEIAYVLKKNFPEYFGTNFAVLQEIAANSPAWRLEDGVGMVTNYANEQKVPICGTVEISNCINYYNGVADGTADFDTYGTTTFSIGEYTLRNQLFRFCQWILDHATELDFYWNKPVLLKDLH